MEGRGKVTRKCHHMPRIDPSRSTVNSQQSTSSQRSPAGGGSSYCSLTRSHTLRLARRLSCLSGVSLRRRPLTPAPTPAPLYHNGMDGVDVMDGRRRRSFQMDPRENFITRQGPTAASGPCTRTCTCTCLSIIYLHFLPSLILPSLPLYICLVS
jgi:hypothetical protein